MIELSESLKSLYIKTAKKLKGNEKREFIAEVVKGLGIGGQNLAEQELGWNRRKIRKGMGELQNGQPLITISHKLRFVQVCQEREKKWSNS